MQVAQIPLDQLIEPSYDVRTQIIKEDLDDLAESIKAVGILSPLRVFKTGSKYEIEDGHRRYLAARMLCLPTVPCIIIESEEGKREFLKIHANIHSKGLSASEMSRALHDLKDRYGYTIEEMAHLMGRSPGRISQILGIANFHPDILEAMQDGKVSEHIGRELNKINKDDLRVYYLRYTIDGGASINTVKGWVARALIEETMPVPPVYQGSGEPPLNMDYVPRMRCDLCRQDFIPDGLMIMRFCGEDYLWLKGVLPDIWRIRKDELAANTMPQSEIVDPGANLEAGFGDLAGQDLQEGVK